jgi:hypothetical protein
MDRRMLELRVRTPLVCVLALGCVHNRSEPSPRPLEWSPAPPAATTERCELAKPPIVPGGHTALPTAEGELELVDVRGDDRLAVVGDAAFAWSPDGAHLLSATKSAVLIWNASTGVLVRAVALPPSLARTTNVQQSPDGEWIAVGGLLGNGNGEQDGGSSVFVFRASGEGPVQAFGPISTAPSFSEDSQQLVTQTRRWDLATGRVTNANAPELGGPRLELAEGERVIVLARNGAPPNDSVTPELRETASGRLLYRFPPLASVLGAAVSADGKRFASLDGGKLYVYSTETFAREVLITAAGNAQWLHLSRDGRRAVTEVIRCGAFDEQSRSRAVSGCPAPELTVWDLDKKATLLQTPNGSGAGWLFTPDGEYLTGTESRLVDYLLRIRDGKELRFGGRIFTISPRSRRVLYEGKGGLEIAALEGNDPVPAFERLPHTLARSGDGLWQIAAGTNGALHLYSASTCYALPIVASFGLSPNGKPVERAEELAFSTDSSALYAVTHPTEVHARVRAFETKTGRERWALQAFGGRGGNATLLANANQVLFQGTDHPELLRFAASTGEPLPPGEMPRLGYVVGGSGMAHDVRSHDGDRASTLYAPIANRDGTRLAMSYHLGNTCMFSVWDPQSAREVSDRTVGCLSPIKALSPDDPWIAAGTERGAVLLLGWQNEAPRRIEAMHEGKTTAIVFAAHGKRLVVADERGAIVMADPASNRVTGRARLPLDYAKSLWVSPDGNTLVADTARGMRLQFRLNRP